jgi:hypothetical protein
VLVHPQQPIWRRWIAVALLVAIAAALAGGCGGNGSGASEDALRARLETGVAKLARARSLRASTLYQVETEESPAEPGQGPCVNIAVDRREGPLRIELLSFDQSCAGGGEAQDVIIVGSRAWVSNNQPERWAPAKLAAGLPKQLTDERGKFKRLLAAASDIQRGGTGAYSTPSGDFEEGPEIDFTAPASSFSQVPGTESTDVDFRALLDRQGYLRELVASVGEGEEGVTVTQTYEEIGQPQGIAAPDRDEVVGPVAQIRSRRDLENLLGSPGRL